VYSTGLGETLDDGLKLGDWEGDCEGLTDGETLGLTDGETLGLRDGETLGLTDGDLEGLTDGDALADGETLGLSDGLIDGLPCSVEYTYADVGGVKSLDQRTTPFEILSSSI